MASDNGFKLDLNNPLELSMLLSRAAAEVAAGTLGNWPQLLGQAAAAPPQPEPPAAAPTTAAAADQAGAEVLDPPESNAPAAAEPRGLKRRHSSDDLAGPPATRPYEQEQQQQQLEQQQLEQQQLELGPNSQQPPREASPSSHSGGTTGDPAASDDLVPGPGLHQLNSVTMVQQWIEALPEEEHDGFEAAVPRKPRSKAGRGSAAGAAAAGSDPDGTGAVEPDVANLPPAPDSLSLSDLPSLGASLDWLLKSGQLQGLLSGVLGEGGGEEGAGGQEPNPAALQMLASLTAVAAAAAAGEDLQFLEQQQAQEEGEGMAARAGGGSAHQEEEAPSAARGSRAIPRKLVPNNRHPAGGDEQAGPEDSPFLATAPPLEEGEEGRQGRPRRRAAAGVAAAAAAVRAAEQPPSSSSSSEEESEEEPGSPASDTPFMYTAPPLSPQRSSHLYSVASGGRATSSRELSGPLHGRPAMIAGSVSDVMRQPSRSIGSSMKAGSTMRMVAGRVDTSNHSLPRVSSRERRQPAPRTASVQRHAITSVRSRQMQEAEDDEEELPAWGCRKKAQRGRSEAWESEKGSNADAQQGSNAGAQQPLLQLLMQLSSGLSNASGPSSSGGSETVRLPTLESLLALIQKGTDVDPAQQQQQLQQQQQQQQPYQPPYDSNEAGGGPHPGGWGPPSRWAPGQPLPPGAYPGGGMPVPPPAGGPPAPPLMPPPSSSYWPHGPGAPPSLQPPSWGMGPPAPRMPPPSGFPAAPSPYMAHGGPPPPGPPPGWWPNPVGPPVPGWGPPPGAFPPPAGGAPPPWAPPLPPLAPPHGSQHAASPFAGHMAPPANIRMPPGLPGGPGDTGTAAALAALAAQLPGALGQKQHPGKGGGRPGTGRLPGRQVGPGAAGIVPSMFAEAAEQQMTAAAAMGPSGATALAAGPPTPTAAAAPPKMVLYAMLPSSAPPAAAGGGGAPFRPAAKPLPIALQKRFTGAGAGSGPPLPGLPPHVLLMQPPHVISPTAGAAGPQPPVVAKAAPVPVGGKPGIPYGLAAVGQVGKTYLARVASGKEAEVPPPPPPPAPKAPAKRRTGPWESSDSEGEMPPESEAPSQRGGQLEYGGDRVLRYRRVITCKTYLLRMHVPAEMADKMLPTPPGHYNTRDIQGVYSPLFKVAVHLVDPTGRVWKVQYEGSSYKDQKHPRLTRGWRDFIRTHSVGIGDTLIFERRSEDRQVLHVYIERRGQPRLPLPTYSGANPAPAAAAGGAEAMEPGGPSPAPAAADSAEGMVEPEGTSPAPAASDGAEGMVEPEGTSPAPAAADGAEGMVEPEGTSPAPAASDGAEGMVEPEGTSPAPAAADGAEGVVEPEAAAPAPAASDGAEDLEPDGTGWATAAADSTGDLEPVGTSPAADAAPVMAPLAAAQLGGGRDMAGLADAGLEGLPGVPTISQAQVLQHSPPPSPAAMAAAAAAAAMAAMAAAAAAGAAVPAGVGGADPLLAGTEESH